MFELTATAAQIMEAIQPTKKPIPNVKKPMTTVRTRSIKAPGTVAYNKPRGPKKNVNKSAANILFFWPAAIIVVVDALLD